MFCEQTIINQAIAAIRSRIGGDAAEIIVVDGQVEGGALEAEDCAGGAFDLRIDSRRMAFRITEMAASLRSRLTRIPYGDQAIFIRTSYFRRLGGFKEIPIMEDVELMQRIKQSGQRIAIFREPVMTSARRWEKEGLAFGTLRNWFLMIMYLCGVTPERLARFYREGP